ncbi:retron Ec67 family RNA-directed DNA polymerase/endonuclease [Photobacterium damselae]|uniref:retron Ec67 family RNA-directed DNA polymerase/endonuclease n=1 Tax=Photobacterium damselae TaxID=38293 RepID=UPI001EE14F21|nr:retron Ec67 family RNA-directed DNA polymerase/endonuclease [Photobacterium damselae]MCG3825942.1 RNA-directed DNA polymerase [Photobacterium damselae]
MTKIELLRKATHKRELAALLGCTTSALTYVLYILKVDTQYKQFEIDKRNGGKRIITAPTDRLKRLQASLSNLLLDCIDDINRIKYPNSQVNSPKLINNKFKDASADILKVKISNAKTKQPSLSHGFVRERSIITNAMMHLDKKNVLNIDLHNFFDSFNFGRVRGFFISNENFKLDPNIATVIAQIACYDNKLPQGSPCSPVISNLITHSLDIRLASLAKKNSCTYSRYADDITFSTRKSVFPTKIMRQEDGEYIPSKKLRNEIKKSGFTINNKKTRIQYKDSRQDVTGLIVNKKPNVKKEYWRTVKSQCHSLFQTGAFTKKVGDDIVEGNINELEGQLNFIDQVDLYNRLRQKKPLNPVYKHATHGYNTSILLSGRERTFSRFLYFTLFYGNTKPTILCEGKTDNVYLKSAINKLAATYPALAQAKTPNKEYELLIRFLEYSKRTRFLLELYGGTSYLNYFIGKFDKNFKFYKAPTPQHPVIIILDNDSGFVGKKDSGIAGKLKKIDSATAYPTTLKKDDFRNADFIYVIHNLYIVLTPLGTAKETAIEDLFDDETRQVKVSGKSFNHKDDRDNAKEYGKEVFAQKVIKAHKSSINFDGLKPLLDRVVQAIEHYDTISAAK